MTLPPVTPQANGPRLAPAPLPSPVVGESYEFDDGRLDTVVAVNGERVSWRNKYGVIVERYRNIIVPDLGWKSRSRVSTLETDASPTALWPLAVGNESPLFTTTQTLTWLDGSALPRTFANDWRCRVTGTRTVTVPAGTFDTYAVACGRADAGSTLIRQVRTFDYAPSLGYFVKRTDDYLTARSRHISLINAGFNSTVLPKAEQIALTRTLFKVLDNNRDGQAGSWARADGSLSVTLTPLTTFASAKGEHCRSYRSTYRYRGPEHFRVRSNERKLCQRANGTWYRVLE